MVDPYSEIINHEEDNWQEFFERICLIDIFKPVIEAYGNTDTLKCVIRYIVYAYSVNSDKIILSMEWHKNKQQIFEFVLAKPEKGIYEELVLLKSEAVLQAVCNWVDFQDSDSFKQLSVLRDLRVEMQISALSKIVKSSGEVDYDQKFKNAEYANKLKIMIRDLEAEQIQNNQKLKDAVKEVKAVKSKFTVGPETFSK